MLHKLNVQQLFGLFILGLICFMPFHASAQSDFTHSVVKLTSTSAKITFTPNNTMQWVIIHFTVNRGQQQNVNMVNNAGTWEHSLTGLVEGDSIDYSFTYFNGTAATDSLWFNAPFGTPAATSTSAPQPFSHSLVTVNATSAKLLFTPDNPMTWVEVHYKVNRGEQQNVQMTKNGATWEYTITGLAASNTIDYFFTYFDTAATDSPWFSTRFGGTPVATATPGTPVATATPGPTATTPAAASATVDDFEIATLPLGTDSFGNNVGFVIFGGENPTLSLTTVLTETAMARPGQGASNKILKIDYNVSTFGGFTHAFENATLNSWVSQNWKSYTGVSFWLYGANTGKPIQFEIFDNRGSGSTKDTAERYINKVTDNFTGWKKIEIPFTAFTRNIDYQPIGAPNDGLGLTEVWAYALNLPGGTGAQTAYIDDVFLYGGSTTAPTATPTPSGPTPTATPSGPTATPAPSNWVLEWSDEFEGAANTGLNTSNWLYDLGHSYPGGANNWGTGEIAEMTNSLDNVYLDGNGNLAIKPIRTGNNWTSGRIETQRLDFEAPAGGKMAVEGRIQVPNVTGAAAQGYWPAFWMLGGPFRGIYTNWPEVGEIDILENVNGTNTLYSTFHCGVAPGGPCNEFTGIGGNISGSIPTLQEAFHTYRMEFDRTVSPEQIRFYLDGKLFHTVKADQVDATTWKNATNHGFFIILNVAMGGNWPGLPTANTVSGIPMLVDYIKVYYSYSPTAPTPTPTITPTPGKVAATVIPPTGGSLASSDNKTTVQFPNGVLNESVNLSITVLTKTTYVTTGFKIGSYVYQIIATNNQGVRVTQFNQPFSIVFNYQDSDWAGLGEESALKPYYWSPSEKRWVNIMPCTGCSQDMENNKLTIQLNHLTDFALLIATTQRIYLPVIVK